MKRKHTSSDGWKQPTQARRRLSEKKESLKTAECLPKVYRESSFPIELQRHPLQRVPHLERELLIAILIIQSDELEIARRK